MFPERQCLPRMMRLPARHRDGEAPDLLDNYIEPFALALSLGDSAEPNHHASNDCQGAGTALFLVVRSGAFHFFFGAQEHRDTLVQTFRLNVENALVAVG